MTKPEKYFQMSLRLKPHIANALDELSKRIGVNKTAVLILALRDLAVKEGVAFHEDGKAPEDGK
jgi:predicted transcriptional regulator